MISRLSTADSSDQIAAANKQAKINDTEVTGAAVEIAGAAGCRCHRLHRNTTTTSPVTKNIPALAYLVLPANHEVRHDARWLADQDDDHHR